MDIRIGNNSSQSGQRIAETDNPTGLPSVNAKQAAAPLQTVNAVQKTATAPSMSEIGQALEEINKAMKRMSQDLEFSLDDDGHRTIVRVVDTETKDVIRQIPTPVVLEISKALERLQGLLIREKA